MLDRGRNDPLYDEARELVIARSHPSAAFLQRHYSIGYNRATAILEDLEADGVVTRPDPANGKRTVQKPMPPADAVREALDQLFNMANYAPAARYVETIETHIAALTARVAELMEIESTLEASADAMTAMRQRAEQAESRLAALAGAAPDADELTRLYELAGYGGVSADAPERIILASSMYDGLECCDKWCCVDRVVDDGQSMPESATAYIRADLAAPAAAKAREVTDADVLKANAAYWREYYPSGDEVRGMRAALATFAEGE